MENLTSTESLNVWLIEHGIDTSVWGVGVAKSVEDLWTEILQGESQLESAPLLRLVQVVNVIIRCGDRILVEVEQQFNGNQVRYQIGRAHV